uniref:Uncharacterized protein n=1 Tax=Arundo donax TaxID=35708 RepID=A0A0A9DHR4_ARUDO
MWTTHGTSVDTHNSLIFQQYLQFQLFIPSCKICLVNSYSLLLLCIYPLIALLLLLLLLGFEHTLL